MPVSASATAAQVSSVQSMTACKTFSTPDETLVGASQIRTHGITLNVGDAVISRGACDVCGIAAVCLYACAGDHQALIRQDPGQSPIAAAVGGLLQTHLQAVKHRT